MLVRSSIWLCPNAICSVAELFANATISRKYSLGLLIVSGHSLEHGRCSSDRVRNARKLRQRVPGQLRRELFTHFPEESVSEDSES